MSANDYYDQPRINYSALILNILTVVVLLVTLCLGSVFVILLINPQSPLNLFPPDPLPTRVSTWTPSPPAAQRLSPTWTPPPPTATKEPTVTSTPRPTRTPTPTITPFTIGTQTPGAGADDATPTAPFVLRGDPLYVPNFVHSDLGCSWMGVAGQAFDLSGAPLLGLTVRLGGNLGGTLIDFPPTLTGVVKQYGEGGYEFTLADTPIASSGTLYIQLLDQALLPLSEEIFFDTFEDCEKNLILINFQQVREP